MEQLMVKKINNLIYLKIFQTDWGVHRFDRLLPRPFLFGFIGEMVNARNNFKK